MIVVAPSIHSWMALSDVMPQTPKQTVAKLTYLNLKTIIFRVY